MIFKCLKIYIPVEFFKVLYNSVNGVGVIFLFCVNRYLDYGEETWKKEAAKCLSGLETYVL